jgi:hypothetical protein
MTRPFEISNFRSQIPVSALHASVLNAFKQMGWAYRKVEEDEVIEADFEAHHTKVSLHVQSFGAAGIMSVVAGASFPVPATHYLAAAELLMRVNKELTVGNFELEWDSGQVLFRITNVFPPNRADERIISGLVHSAVAEVDRITPFLGEICRTPKGELLLLRIPELLGREELLPPPVEGEESSSPAKP